MTAAFCALARFAARAQVALDAAGLSTEERAAAVEGIVEGYGWWLWEATGGLVWE